MTTTDSLARVLELAQAALDDPSASAEDLAARSHLSRFHFDRLVRAAGGEPPGALRRRVLLERAAYRLLRDPGRSVLDVGVEAGYGSHEAFTRAFTRAHGVTPTGLRAAPPATVRGLALPGASGVHFRPPAGLRLPAPRKESSMDVLQHLVDHHVDSLAAIIAADEAMLDTFVDTACEPPSTHTIGGTIAHVVTFAAVRRTLAVGALWTAGIRDLDQADPRPGLDALAAG